jgi:hypothetical protein
VEHATARAHIQAGVPGHALKLAGNRTLGGGASPLTSNCRSTSSSSSLSSIRHGIMAAVPTPIPPHAPRQAGASFKRGLWVRTPGGARPAFRSHRNAYHPMGAGVCAILSQRGGTEHPKPILARATAGLHTGQLASNWTLDCRYISDMAPLYSPAMSHSLLLSCGAQLSQIPSQLDEPTAM